LKYNKITGKIADIAKKAHISIIEN